MQAAETSIASAPLLWEWVLFVCKQAAVSRLHVSRVRIIIMTLINNHGNNHRQLFFFFKKKFITMQLLLIIMEFTYHFVVVSKVVYQPKIVSDVVQFAVQRFRQKHVLFLCNVSKIARKHVLFLCNV